MRNVLCCYVRKYVGNIFHDVDQQREYQIVERYLCIDHVHMCSAISPRCSVRELVGFIKGKCAIAMARDKRAERGILLDVAFGARLLRFHYKP